MIVRSNGVLWACAYIVHQDVDLAEAFDGLIAHLDHLVAISNVPNTNAYLSTERFAAARRLVHGLFRVGIDDERGTCLRE